MDLAEVRPSTKPARVTVPSEGHETSSEKTSMPTDSMGTARSARSCMVPSICSSSGESAGASRYLSKSLFSLALRALEDEEVFWPAEKKLDDCQ